MRAADQNRPGPRRQADGKHLRAAIKHGEQLNACIILSNSPQTCVVGIDPARGCLSFEATDFLIRPQHFGRRDILILWQVEIVGDGTWKPKYDNLVRRIVGCYGGRRLLISAGLAARYP